MEWSWAERAVWWGDRGLSKSTMKFEGFIFVGLGQGQTVKDIWLTAGVQPNNSQGAAKNVFIQLGSAHIEGV